MKKQKYQMQELGKAVAIVTIVFTVLSVAAVSSAAAEVNATNQDIDPSGSTIKIVIDDASGGIDPPPEGWEASNPSGDGQVFATGGINWGFDSVAKRTVSVTITPPDDASDGDSVTLTTYDGSGNEEDFIVNVTQSNVQKIYVDDQTVYKKTSRVELTFNSTVSGGIVIPDGWEAKEVSKDGDKLKTPEVNWDFGRIVNNRTVSLGIKPPSDTSVGDSVTLKAYEGTGIEKEFTISVSKARTHESGVNKNTYDAVANLAGSKNEVGGRSLSSFRRDLVTGDYKNSDKYVGVDVSGRQYSKLVRYLTVK